MLHKQTLGSGYCLKQCLRMMPTYTIPLINKVYLESSEFRNNILKQIQENASSYHQFLEFLEKVLENPTLQWTKCIPWTNKFSAALRESLDLNTANGRTFGSPILGTQVPTGIAQIGIWSAGNDPGECVKYRQRPVKRQNCEDKMHHFWPTYTHVYTVFLS